MQTAIVKPAAGRSPICAFHGPGRRPIAKGRGNSPTVRWQIASGASRFGAANHFHSTSHQTLQCRKVLRTPSTTRQVPCQAQVPEGLDTSRGEPAITDIATFSLAGNTVGSGFHNLDGVISATIGFTGGRSAKPNFKSIESSDGHSLAVRVEFYPDRITYRELLQLFGRQHNMFSKPHQRHPNDRALVSRIYAHTSYQQAVAAAWLSDTATSSDGKLYTDILSAPVGYWTFHNADDFLQEMHMRGKGKCTNIGELSPTQQEKKQATVSSSSSAHTPPTPSPPSTSKNTPSRRSRSQSHHEKHTQPSLIQDVTVTSEIVQRPVQKALTNILSSNGSSLANDDSAQPALADPIKQAASQDLQEAVLQAAADGQASASAADGKAVPDDVKEALQEAAAYGKQAAPARKAAHEAVQEASAEDMWEDSHSELGADAFDPELARQQAAQKVASVIQQRVKHKSPMASETARDSTW